MNTSGQRDDRRASGFSLVELLVVISVLMLLVAILVPSLQRAKESAYDAKCKANLRRLADVLHAATGEDPSKQLSASAWIGEATRHDGGGLLRCPKDESEHRASPGDLDDVYITQRQGGALYFSYITDILEGRPVPDPQIHLNPSGIVGDHGWNPDDPGPNQSLICIDDDGALMITLGDVVLLESIDPPGDTSCGSDHWVCRGESGVGWESEILMQLTGNNYQNQIDPRSPLSLSGSAVSYGMNNQVRGRLPRLNQLMLVEYKRTIVDVDFRGNNDDDFDELIAPRHFGKVNYATVNGGVHARTPIEIYPGLVDPDFIWAPAPEWAR